MDRGKVTRQYVVYHDGTNMATLVNHSARVVYVNGKRKVNHKYASVAIKAGIRYRGAKEIQVVPIGQETPLPFGDIPLVIRWPAMEVDE